MVLRGFMGQVVGVISIPLWLGSSVYFMSRAADPTATDTGNWFAAFVIVTLVFVGIMSFWNKLFREEL
jgi:ABC-type nickel/cobalt efflux system permease component RcnA